MPTQLDKNTVLTGLPLVWIGIIDPAGDDPDNIAWLWGFRTAKKVGYKNNLPSTSGGSDKSEIVYADGTKVQFNKIEKLIDLVTETETTDPTKDVEATGLGEISFEAGSAPLKYVTDAFVAGLGWTEWLSILQGYLGKKFLIIVPTGVSYDSRYGRAGTKVADGYAYMIGKLSTGIEQEIAANATSLNMTFVSYLDTTSGLDTAISTLGGTIPSLKIIAGGGSKDLSFTPDALDNDPVNTDSTYLLSGKLLLKGLSYTWS